MIPCTIDHIHLRSLDPVAASKFYIDLFGAWEMRRVMNGDKLRVVLSLAGLTLFIEQVPAETPMPPTPPFLGYEHIGLTVPDIAAAMAIVKARNIPVVMDLNVLSPELTIAFIEGPDRVRIELLQRK